MTHQRTETPVASSDATTGADGTALVDLPMTAGSGDFEVTASAQTPENRTVEGQHLGVDLERRGRVVHARTRRRRSWPTRRATRWATRRTCCW